MKASRQISEKLAVRLNFFVDNLLYTKVYCVTEKLITVQNPKEPQLLSLLISPVTKELYFSKTAPQNMTP